MNAGSGNTPQQQDENDAGAPLPDFRTSGIQLTTVAPAFGVAGGGPGGASPTPDYLDYDPKGRGLFVTMFANSGMSYLLGTTAGGLYGLRSGLHATPSNRFRVKLNSVLNHCGRYGSRVGNRLGVFAVLYSLYEGAADYYELEDMLGVRSVSPAMASLVSPGFGAMATGATYFAPSGPRVAALAGAIGIGSVALTYASYSVLGIPYGSGGYLFF